MHTHFSLTLHISWSIICLFCPFVVIAYLKLSLPSKKWISFGSLCRRHVRRSVHVTALADRVWLVVLPVSEMSRVKNGSIDQCVQISPTSPGSSRNHLEIFPTLHHQFVFFWGNPGGRCSHQSCQHPTRSSCWPLPRTISTFSNSFQQKELRVFFWFVKSWRPFSTPAQKEIVSLSKLCH